MCQFAVDSKGKFEKMKVVFYHRELVKRCFRHSVSSALVAMIVTDANHEFLVMTARLITTARCRF